VALDSLSRVGFGCYRVALGVEAHQAALSHALALGCTLVDTASNYGAGRSEELVGEVLSSNPQYSAFVVTKAGYITPAAEARLNAAGVSTAALYPISAESKYSLAPDVLRVQLEESSRRLRRPRLDALLLHNPEHYFDCEGREKSQQDYYGEIQRAFELLEECVAAGKLRYYGVSSNTLAFSPNAERRTHLARLLAAAEAVSTAHHFRFVEFPFNFAETEALTPQANGRSLLDDIKASGLLSLANRPLNSQRDHQLLRFATYEDEKRELDPAAALAAYDTCVELIGAQLVAANLPHKVMDFAVMQFLRDNWRGVEHPDTVDQIFGRHFYPFIERLWDETLPDRVRVACAALHRYARLYAKQRLSEQGRELRADLIRAGVISRDDKRSLATIACDFCLQSGLDHVLVGMRTTKYVESLSELIAPRARP
jgi:aryl-alcohol dehydrogenase-like predicted oxidoreductase